MTPPEEIAAKTLRTARGMAGLSQTEFARKAGVAQATVSAYENSRRQPTLPTLCRLVAAAGCELRVRVSQPLAGYQPMALASLAAYIAASLEDEPRVVRLMLEFLTEYCGAEPAQRQGLIDPPPAPTGDRRWDAFLGALAEHLAFHDDLRCPAWAGAPERFLDRWWFLSNTPSGRAEAIVTAPASFMRRGVFIARRDLERV